LYLLVPLSKASKYMVISWIPIDVPGSEKDGITAWVIPQDIQISLSILILWL
jgi:hypothetical protein